ncbi:MAG: histidine phosphatase family protein [Lachnospiraceae bacterium]|nr:histidine phosphatase family protein [Lachnospiraceae bacterium]
MLYIMRHGSTDWNENHKLQGRVDIPLNENGRDMARKAADLYKDVHLDVCYCSPLIRARETADIVLNNRNIPIITDDRLKEMSFGIFEGIENYFERSDCPISALFRDPEKYTEIPEGAESFEQLFTRTGEFLEEVIDPELKKGKDVLIVGHGAMNTSIICRIRDIPVKDFWSVGIEQCKLIELKC